VIAANYYEASVPAWTFFDALSGDQSCDILIVGGGLLVASTALHLAEAGLDVILVEKHSIGLAASGRNGGQLTPGLARWQAADMIAKLTLDDAKRLWRFASIEAMDLIDDLVHHYSLDVDRKHGHITAAVHPAHLGPLVEDADARCRLGDGKATIVGQYVLEQYVASSIYYGGSIDALGGQLHPLALVRGLVQSFVQQGGRVYEGTEVLDLVEGPRASVATISNGTITVRKGVVLAVHHATFKFLTTASTTVPFYTYVGVTPPLQQDIRLLLPADMPVYDTQYQIDYYRAVHANRLLFGGQGTGSSWSPAKINDYLLGRIRTVFPQLADPKLEFSWSGISDFTLNGATDCRRTGDTVRTYTVHGWSGHGVAQTVRIGKAISDDITGRNGDFEMLTRIDHTTIPLGRQLSPIGIPLVKGALSAYGAIRPGALVSF
jgi:gamma-glutamylputrescine oxidase